MTVWVIMDFDEFVAVAATETAARERAESHADAALKSGHYGRDAERQFRWAGLQLERYGMAFGRSGWHQSGFWLIESELVGGETASAVVHVAAGNGVCLEGGDRADVALCNDCGVDVGAEHADGCDVARCLVTGLQRLSCGEEHDCGADVWTGKWPAVARTLDVAEETVALARPGGAQ